jgi:hypothetical protein
MRGRAIEIVSAEQLATWPTKRLLGLRDRLLRCEDSPSHSDSGPREIAALAAAHVHFKDDPRWTALHSEVRRALASRENVIGGDERATKRERRARLGRTHERPPKPIRR